MLSLEEYNRLKVGPFCVGRITNDGRVDLEFEAFKGVHGWTITFTQNPLTIRFVQKSIEKLGSLNAFVNILVPSSPEVLAQFRTR